MSGDDLRTGPDDNGKVTIAAGDGNTPQTALNNRDDALYSLEAIKIEYDEAATATIDIAVFDDADGTSSGNVSDERDRIMNIDPGESVTIDYDGMRDIEEDVLVQEPGGNQDADVHVTVMGTRLVALKDVMYSG